jgi:hypothetical protein
LNVACRYDGISRGYMVPLYIGLAGRSWKLEINSKNAFC